MPPKIKEAAEREARILRRGSSATCSLAALQAVRCRWARSSKSAERFPHHLRCSLLSALGRAARRSSSPSAAHWGQLHKPRTSLRDSPFTALQLQSHCICSMSKQQKLAQSSQSSKKSNAKAKIFLPLCHSKIRCGSKAPKEETLALLCPSKVRGVCVQTMRKRKRETMRSTSLCKP